MIELLINTYKNKQNFFFFSKAQIKISLPFIFPGNSIFLIFPWSLSTSFAKKKFDLTTRRTSRTSPRLSLIKKMSRTKFHKCSKRVDILAAF